MGLSSMVPPIGEDNHPPPHLPHWDHGDDGAGCIPHMWGRSTPWHSSYYVRHKGGALHLPIVKILMLSSTPGPTALVGYLPHQCVSGFTTLTAVTLFVSTPLWWVCLVNHPPWSRLLCHCPNDANVEGDIHRGGCHHHLIATYYVYWV